ncbi:unnamed protein product [Linum tenue]|uniref:Josephin-like protein n=1 Tax=Linum tenue TaxID=586396 RepID=A0AAV0Q637_9ROSI|nr:unnamed protein product [Linum tenue]
MLTKSNSQGNHTPGGIGKGGDSGKCRSGESSPGFRFCRRPKRSELLLPGRFFRHLADKLSKAICLKCRASSRVSSSSSSSAGGGSRQFVAPIDVYRKEAIEECIEFINHSSTLPRSKSVSV